MGVRHRTAPGTGERDQLVTVPGEPVIQPLGARRLGHLHFEPAATDAEADAALGEPVQGGSGKG